MILKCFSNSLCYHGCSEPRATLVSRKILRERSLRVTGGYESGRSMVEMLAVLAIISILGIAAIIMYRSVMDGYKADTLYNDIKTRLILANERKERLFSTDLGNQSTFGLPILLERNKPVMGYNKVTITNVPENICKRLLMKEWPADTAEKSKARIYVNNLPYPTKIQKCPDGLSTFAVAYRSSFALDNNLAKICTENSECNACEKCLNGECKIDCGDHGTCFEGECGCDEGYTLNENECVLDTCGGVTCTGATTCIDNQCVCTGYIDNTGCHPCPDHATCDGETFSCDTANQWYLVNGECQQPDLSCTHDNQFKNADGTCTWCSTLDKVAVTNEVDCMACKANSNSAARKMKNGYCVRESCGSGWFPDQEGVCKSCNIVNGIYVEDEADCMACSGTRQMESGRCALINCPDGRYKENGWCSDCTQTGARLVQDTACETVCPNRQLIYDSATDGYWCVNMDESNAQNCGGDKFFWQSDSEKLNEGVCVSCATTESKKTVAAACAMCNGRRKMVEDKCVCAGYKSSGKCNACPDHAICDGTNITGCENDYYLSGATCLACPDHAICDGTNITGCENDYYLSGATCLACPDHAICDGTNITGCENDYYLSGATCLACPDNATCAGDNVLCKSGFYWSRKQCKACISTATCSNNTATCNAANQWLELTFDNWQSDDREITAIKCLACTNSNNSTTFSADECNKCSGYRFLGADSKGEPKCYYCGKTAYSMSGTNLDQNSCNACLNREYQNGNCVCDAEHAYNSNKNCCPPGKHPNNAKTACVAD